MNILFLTTHFNTGGITSYILTLGRALVKSGNKVVVVSSGGDCEGLLSAQGIRHIKMDIRTKSELHPKLWITLPFLKELVQKEKIDIIHAQTRVTQVLGAVLSKMSDVVMITTCHGFFRPRWFRKTFPCWGRAVIAISKPVANHLKVDFGIPQENIHLVFNGVDLDLFCMASKDQRLLMRQKLQEGDGPLIGIIARLSSVKGIDILIKAMPLILKKIPSAKLMIAGQGPEEQRLRKLTENLFLTQQVHFKNTTNQSPDLLPAFDVFVMPSIMEGLGLSVMEAQACGIPVVASRVGGLIDLIEDGKTGFLVAPGDISALANGVIRILLDPQQSQLMAKQARVNIEQQFSAQQMLKQTLGIYEQYSCR